MLLQIPLAKIDEEKRLVIGRAVQEVPDRSGEIIDYTSAKPAFEAWSSEIEQATGGLSKGNLRVMHDPKSVAGKVVQLEFNDADRAVEIVAKVVDDQAWKKVLEGCFTGFSVGGSYAKKWTDPKTGLKKYTPKVTEISLVDNPCIPTCRIAELHKSDGTVGELALRGRARTFDEVLAATRTPRSFDAVLAGRLAKSAWSDQPREHDGKFATKGGAHLGAATGIAAGLVGGALLGRRYGARVGERLGVGLMRAMHRGKPEFGIIGEKVGAAAGQKLGPAVAGIAGAIAGAKAGGSAGGAVDEHGRKRRARAAGRLEQYEAMKAKVKAGKDPGQ